MIDFYYWPTPNGWKISIMLEECGLEYRVHGIDIGKGDQFKPEFVAINPNSKIPAIVDSEGPDGNPMSLFESGLSDGSISLRDLLAGGRAKSGGRGRALADLAVGAARGRGVGGGNERGDRAPPRVGLRGAELLRHLGLERADLELRPVGEVVGDFHHRGGAGRAGDRFASRRADINLHRNLLAALKDRRGPGLSHGNAKHRAASARGWRAYMSSPRPIPEFRYPATPQRAVSLG